MAPSRGPDGDRRVDAPNLRLFELPDPGTPESETPTIEHFTNLTDTSSNHDEDNDSDLEMNPLADSSHSSSASSNSSRSPSPRRGMLSHSSSSLLMSSYFAPPFYNKPPTPLPPSPSLTSLLKPPFSTTTSRPSTPDSSDIETESAVAKSARISSVPRASPKVPTYEYYGFVLYLMSSLAFLMYLLWSYLPAPFLEKLGIYYYPNRWWSLALPSSLVMTIVYIYVALASYNTGYLTLPMQSIENMVDEASHVAVLDGNGQMIRKGHRLQGKQRPTRPKAPGKVDWSTAWNEGTDAVMDIPIGGVCEVLYGDR